MNSENDSIKNPQLPDAIEIDETSSIDDFIKELEAKEKDLQLSVGASVIEINDSDSQTDELAELEKFLESFEKHSALASDAKFLTVASGETNQAATARLEKEIAELHNELSKAERERAEIIESFRRRQSDFDNFKKRVEREKDDTHRSILSGLATQMLPVVDNLTRAIASAKDHGAEKNPDFSQFVEGIVMVNHQLNEVLEGIGIKPIVSVGEPFDPHFHEAVATEESDKFPPNTVTEELIRGYKIEGKVIRPAMVKVSSAVKTDEPILLDLE